MMPQLAKKKGFMLIQTIVFAGIAVVIVSSLVAWAGINLRNSRSAVYKEKALQVAEAGIEYYRWHLAHAPQDYFDGHATSSSSYTHNFYDKDGVEIGYFILRITPPIPGSTIVTIESEGHVSAQPTLKRIIRTQLAIPSLAKYAFVSNSDMRFGAGTEVFGPIHSNGGIRFDGFAHNIVSSAQSTYNDPDSDDCNGGSSFGVHTCDSPNDPSPPAAVPSRPDVFESGRQFPVQAIDFVGMTNNLSQIKTDAQASGRYFAASGALGYKIVLNAVSGGTDTFTISRVNTLRAAPSGCTTSGETGWGTWSIGTGGGALTVIGTYPIPSNGLIFVEDNAWVQGSISDTRVTIASGKFPDNASTRTSITVNEDINYTYTDGRDVVALIAQNNINAGLYSADVLDIDAALMAQNGRIGRYHYNTSCKDSGSNGTQWWHRTTLNLYGMIGSSARYGFSFTGSNWNCGGSIGNIGSGYCARNITYDANLLYGPPPSFPLTSDQYSIISWEEI